MIDYEDVLAPFAATVVTGGSSGIGKSFIERMGEANPRMVFCNLSRRAPEGLSPGTAARLRHIPCDLGVPDQRVRAAGEAIGFIRTLDHRSKLLLINNSGFGSYGFFPSPDCAVHLDMVQVNVSGVIDLTARLLPELRARGGAIITVASTAAFQATPLMATYGATKAFVLSWSLALADELRPDGITVQALCPGPTRTAFRMRAGPGLRPVGDGLSLDVADVVDASLRGLRRGSAVVVPGWRNRLLAAVAAVLPRTWAARAAGAAMRRYRLVGGDAPGGPGQ